MEELGPAQVGGEFGDAARTRNDGRHRRMGDCRPFGAERRRAETSAVTSSAVRPIRRVVAGWVPCFPFTA
jgi:hypothetical protein